LLRIFHNTSNRMICCVRTFAAKKIRVRGFALEHFQIRQQERGVVIAAAGSRTGTAVSIEREMRAPATGVVPAELVADDAVLLHGQLLHRNFLGQLVHIVRCTTPGMTYVLFRIRRTSGPTWFRRRNPLRGPIRGRMSGSKLRPILCSRGRRYLGNSQRRPTDYPWSRDRRSRGG
jgi:hypothetical protein